MGGWDENDDIVGWLWSWKPRGEDGDENEEMANHDNSCKDLDLDGPWEERIKKWWKGRGLDENWLFYFIIIIILFLHTQMTQPINSKHFFILNSIWR